jgi:hypothetical protein
MSAPYRGLGPPDPIEYLRANPPAHHLSEVDEEAGPVLTDVREETSTADDTDKKEVKTDKKEAKATPPPQDPPARERPSDGADWPYRETLS